MRDAESLLDQVLAYAGDHLTRDAVREAVGLADEGAIVELLDALEAGDAPAALDRIEAFGDLGRDMAQVALQAEGEARRRLLHSVGNPAAAGRLARILRGLAEASGLAAREGRARLALELLAVEAAPAGVTVAAPATSVSVSVPRAQPKATPSVAKPVAPAPAPPTPATTRTDPGDVRARWAEIVERAAPAIKPLLRECRPVALDGARVTLAFPEERGFMREKAKTRAAAIEQLLSDVLGGSWAIDCVSSNVELEPLSVAAAVAANPEDPDGRALLEGVLRITGGELVDVPEVH
jgi:hypothetical protein